MKKGLVILFCMVTNIGGYSQSLTMQDLQKAFEKDTSITLQRLQVKIESYNYAFEGNNVESIILKPLLSGKRPGLLLIPGYSKTATDYIPIALQFAREGFACIVITQRGFGRSAGEPDFVGPKTLAGLEFGLQKFLRESFVDSSSIGIYGYSRGAMAASLLACRMPFIKAAVFGAGIYDLKKAFEEISLEEIKGNIRNEAGTTDEAFRIRSSINEMENLKAEVLIMHGTEDENAPPSQAYLLESKLKELNKLYEIQIFKGVDHNLGMLSIKEYAVDFFKRKLLN